MSEWLDNQKKPIYSTHELLQERIEKANPRRELTTEESKRLNKLEAIADELKRGENVQNSQLQTWLSEEEYEQLEYEWQGQLELRSELKDKPSELKRYEEKLKQATFNYNRTEGYSSKRHQKTQNEQTTRLFVHSHRCQINKTTEKNAENTLKVHGLYLFGCMVDAVTDWHSGALCKYLLSQQSTLRQAQKKRAFQLFYKSIR